MSERNFRYIFFYESKRGNSAAETGRNINVVFEEDFAKERTTRHWFEMFRPGDESLEDEDRDDVMCSGVLISKKHVLTAAHCVSLIEDRKYQELTASISKLKPYAGDCSEFRKKRIVPRPDMFSILVGSQCVDPKNCSIKYFQPAKVHFRDDFGDCNGDNDLALFELHDDVSDQIATPICMPTRATKLSRSLKVAGAGLTAPPINGNEQLNGFQTVNVSFIRLWDDTIATTMPPGTGICGVGDCTITDYNKSISPGKPWNPCDSYNENVTDFSTDVRLFLDWICDKSGICPEQNNNKVELYEREHSIDLCGEAQSSPQEALKKPSLSPGYSSLYFICAASLSLVFLAFSFRTCIKEIYEPEN